MARSDRANMVLASALSTALRPIAVAIVMALLWLGYSGEALAQCSPEVAGVVTCTANPGPVAYGEPPVTTLNVNSLTGNIAAAGAGQSGVKLTSTRSTPSTPSASLVDGDDGTDGPSAGAININLVGSGPTFALSTTDGIGIEARSIGANGGRGGDGQGGAVLPGLGGDGGGGGGGGAVSVITTGAGTITTFGTNHHGILGLSQGGNGGNGGDGDTVLGVYGAGGDGGGGGAPSTVTISNTLNINANGTGSAGIWAQSVGAGGGNGGDVAGSVFGDGGDGAASSSGGAVSVTSGGAINTTGWDAAGIYAQSVGGFAGSGGGAYGVFSFGGSPASAGSGGTVTVETLANSSITTIGQNSQGIFAQSVGGGGGAGGDGVGVVGFGGGGGGAGNGEKVLVTNRATIDTTGNGAGGVFAQSVGGGGGTGGTGVGVATIGGSGGGGGDGGVVEVQNSGNIIARGNGEGFETGAYGIFAQSVGGGGGSGALGAGVFAFGGSGGAAGNGKNVTVGNTATITSGCVTGCRFTGAIYAQSVGGGGGHGGGGAGVLSMGASGGGGGNGGEVRVTNSNTLMATGQFSRGIFAQSVGGGGGDGGFGGGLFTIGGSGGAGGNGQYVSVVNTGNVTTVGADSAGIFAQSVGGGGGNGGNTIGVGVFAAAAFGGSGGPGGAGGNVDVNRTGTPLGASTISTTGDRSAGILAQSIGGGGGNGGFAIAASGGPFFSATLTFGGSGDSGGDAGNVWVGANGAINTNGSFSSGIIAEAIGGGGGRGGFAIAAAGSNGGAVSLAFGADGGKGGAGGLVDVFSSVNISTGCVGCTQSNGILASSIGGGGGSGGFSVAAGVGLAAGIGASFGGDGGEGNVGKVVNVTNTGSITTKGSFSNGILAQSVGGGGGNAGFAASGSFSMQGGNSSFSFGGDGGAGSKGDAVTVAQTGNISTAGDFSHGIVAQSIGGGGGNGGFSGSAGFSVNGTSSELSFGGDGGEGSDGGKVTVRYNGEITTAGNFASGIIAQSLGGGGGTGGFALGVGATLKQPHVSSEIGGDAGNGGISDKVTVTDIFGKITTVGEQSYGIFAQSVAGGGGTGGFSVGAGFSLESDNLTNTVGGDGGLGKQSGEVEVVSNAIIDTGGLNGMGVGSHGILAQSIGGGGGTGGFSGTANFTYKGDTKAFSTGGTAGSAGDANNVSVTSNGKVTTRADGSVGIFAQSVGGGGGVGGFSIGIGGSYKGKSDVSSVGGDGGAAGDAGEVRVKVNADVETFGSLSHGVVAQSIGGGGGYGGFSIAGSFSIKSDASTQSVGGDGAGGGLGKYVEVIVGDPGQLGVPTIHTHGLGSVGVLAQSIGGGGGAGGFAGALSVAVDGKTENDVTGGGGDDGSNGGKVVVKNYGTIITDMNNSAGIVAQSIGGGGGIGGFAIAGAFESEGDGAKNAVGGNGGAGAMGGEVEVTNAGTITTNGDFSHGIFAQSVGGGGGSGGISVAGTISDNGSGATSSVGGSGGSGGNGSKVTVINTGSITVNGQNSQGIYAQSVGGSGGSGGIAGAFDFGGGGVDNLVGGDGAKGGNGGEVYVESTGSIKTVTANSTGVFAQSVGGSGGWAGLALGVGDGGDGSSGIKIGLGSECDITGDDPCNIASLIPIDGSTGKVTVKINGKTNVTEGALSYGMLAQSIAGGGGAAATVILDELNFSGSDVVLNAGSDGSMGGNASFADNDYNTDHTSTVGVGAIGLIVQSIGGGGGVVGNANAALVLNPADPPDDGFYLTAGGYSAGALYNYTGSGGGFALDVAGTLDTGAANAIGIIGQTIGGGGGIVNLTVSSVTNEGDELVIALGGSQVNGHGYQQNAGADSTLTASALVTTKGALSHGIVAQSIGGGGGVSNAVFENGVTLANGTKVIIGSGAAPADDNPGENGGSGGNGGNLIVTANGVKTEGNGAFGIVAQSIGGGGGLTGVSSGQYVLGQAGYTLNPVSIGGGNGGGGNAGSVTVNSNGDVRTAGFGAHGIVAQSIAGGGGIVGNGMFATNIADASAVGSFAGSLGHSGVAGTVSVTQKGNVVVAGANSVGIFGQSASGSIGNNGNVILKLDQSTSGGGNGIGLVWASAGSGAAVQIADGKTNSFTTNGTLYAQGSLYNAGTPPSLGGMAILGGVGDDAITNLARAEGATVTNYTRTNNIIGNVDLGAGANSLLNQSGALFISDNDIKVGAGNLFTNEGFLSPGDRGRVKSATNVTGNFTQTADGYYYVDIDLNAQNTANPVTDKVTITGNGDFDGEGPLLLMSINKAFSNDGYVIASAGGTMTDSGFMPTLTPPAVGFIFRTDVVDKDLVLLADKPSFLSLLQDPASGTTDPNVWRMGTGIDNIEQAITVDDPFNYLINLLRLQPDEKALGDAVTTLTPHQAAHIFEMADRRAMDFVDRASECRNEFGQVVNDNTCFWGTGSGGIYDRGVVEDSPINHDEFQSVAFGAQSATVDGFNAGFGVGASHMTSEQSRDGEPLSSLETTYYQASLSAAYQDQSGFGVSFVAAGSMGEFDTSRYVNIDGFQQTYNSFDGIAPSVNGSEEMPVFSDKTIVFDGINGYATSEGQIYAFNPRLRFSYAMGDPEAVQTLALLDIDGHVLHTPYREEEGVGLANLVYPEMTQTAVTLTPGLEVRLTGELDNGFQVSGYVRGGLQWSPWKNAWVAETQFAAAPDGLPPIEIIEPFDDLRAKLDVGLVVSCPTSGMKFSLNYAGNYGATAMEHQVKGGLSVPIGEGGKDGGC